MTNPEHLNGAIAKLAAGETVFASFSPADAGNAPGFDHVVFVTDNALSRHVRDGLLAQLSTQARCSVQVVAPC